MKSKKSNSRITLDKAADQAIRVMLSELQMNHEFVKINPGKLTSWIVKWFHQTAFEREMAKLARAHFNRRDYLQKALRGVQSEEQVAQILKKALGTVKAKSRPKVTKNNI